MEIRRIRERLAEKLDDLIKASDTYGECVYYAFDEMLQALELDEKYTVFRVIVAYERETGDVECYIEGYVTKTGEYVEDITMVDKTDKFTSLAFQIHDKLSYIDYDELVRAWSIMASVMPKEVETEIDEDCFFYYDDADEEDDEEEEYDAETYGEAKYETEATLFSITVK